MSNNTVWILGSANIDTTYRVHNLPDKGSTLTAFSCKTDTGGKGANQAFAAAYCGARVSFIGAVGRDAMGKKLMTTMRRQGIDTGCVTETNTESGHAVIFVDDRGANCIVVYPGANREIPVDLKIGFAQNDLLVAQLEVNIDAVGKYFAFARKNGAVTVLNPSPYREIPENIIRNTDIIIANENEAAALGGLPINSADTLEECAGRIMALGPKTVIITLGENGAYLRSSNESIAVDGHHVSAVDTQGAGDAFLGSFAGKVAKGCDFSCALAFANAVGALAVTVSGSTQVSMPDLAKVEEMLRDTK